MHEISVAASLIRAVLAQKEEKKLSRISKIVLQIGPLSGIMPEALQFAFEALRPGTPLENAELVMHGSELTTTCNRCAKAFDTSLLLTQCPRCGSEEIQIMGGDEFYIEYLVTENE